MHARFDEINLHNILLYLKRYLLGLRSTSDKIVIAMYNGPQLSMDFWGLDEEQVLKLDFMDSLSLGFLFSPELSVGKDALKCFNCLQVLIYTANKN